MGYALLQVDLGGWKSLFPALYCPASCVTGGKEERQTAVAVKSTAYMAPARRQTISN